jgi:hypothetical protein
MAPFVICFCVSAGSDAFAVDAELPLLLDEVARLCPESAADDEEEEEEEEEEPCVVFFFVFVDRLRFFACVVGALTGSAFARFHSALPFRNSAVDIPVADSTKLSMIVRSSDDTS